MLSRTIASRYSFLWELAETDETVAAANHHHHRGTARKGNHFSSQLLCVECEKNTIHKRLHCGSYLLAGENSFCFEFPLFHGEHPGCGKPFRFLFKLSFSPLSLSGIRFEFGSAVLLLLLLSNIFLPFQTDTEVLRFLLEEIRVPLYWLGWSVIVCWDKIPASTVQNFMMPLPTMDSGAFSSKAYKTGDEASIVWI